MNLGKAFTYPFEDEQWAGKLGLGLLIVIVPILNFAGVGYSIEIIRNVMKGEPRPLPGWDDLGKKLLDGLILFLAGLVYSLPILLLACLPMGILIFPVLLSGNSNTQDLANTLAAAGGIVGLCLLCVIVLYMLALSVLFPAIHVLYARQGTFAACFKFREIFALIGRNAAAFFTAWVVYLGTSIGVSLAAGIVGGILAWVPCGGQLVAFVLGLAAGVYTLLVYSHLFGQFGTLESKELAAV